MGKGMSLIERTQDIQSKVSKLPTDIYGLKYRPSLEPHISDDTDWLGKPDPEPPFHFTPLNHEVLTYAYGKLTAPPKLIVEIGVNRSESYEVSSTSTLLKLKPDECMYIGMDLDDKSSINSVEKNVFTLRCDSADYQMLYKLMDWYGHEQIDFMFVDGWHSVNQVIKEWKYWEKMIGNGVMAFHDTNYHPGPVALLDAIDTDIFSVEWFGRGESDWGVGVVQRLKV
jgi:cephalosporin hydroxylase